MILTNGTTWQQDGKTVTRQFEAIHYCDGMAWVKALNGNYEGELLTFEEKYLRPLLESEK